MERKPSLIFCIIMDLIGYATFALPVLGEWADVLWAPLSAYLFYRTFEGFTGKVGSLVQLIEEILPFTDFIPTFTIGFFYAKYRNRKSPKSV